MEEEKSIRDEIRELKEIVATTEPKKQKKFKIPMKGKVSTKKLKGGYATVVVINENRNVDFIKEPIVDGTIVLRRTPKTFHALSDEDVFFYKNKPIIFQAKNKINPYNPLKDKHETFGQEYIMARMERDIIKPKKSFGGAWLWIILGIVVVGGLWYLLKK